MGGDDWKGEEYKAIVSFNPRPRMGGDWSIFDKRIKGKYVSIHAPAWGATDEARRGGTQNPGFNPRPRMGGDLLIPSWASQH
ncbi:MAG: hypothetical protein SRB1_02931 [Desulfobacteraceae bacterium Eth-SRB1]|nr:MAG: hypothetical protein SRB1_02931 [Desulfobacteraceae bacterium Eth-SRB1]